MTLPLFPSYREIPLTQGKVAIVDEADFEWLSQWKWCATEQSSGWYALRGTRKNGKLTSHRMHRVIMGLLAGDLPQVDHINHDTLDNRRVNLRICTPAQNQHNTRGQSNSKTGYKGVFFDSSHGKYVAKIMVNGKKHHLGSRATAEECSVLYEDAARRLHGEFACTESRL